MKKLLFNPFEKYDARPLLFIGLLGIPFGSLLAYLFGAHYNGALDMHIGSEDTTFVLAFTENIFAIALLFAGLFIFSYSINKKTRPIDILSTVLIARIPLYITTLAGVGGYMAKIDAVVGDDPGTIEKMLPEILPVLLISLLLIPLVIWFFALLYNGVKTASNLKTTKQIVMFIVTILLIEIVSFFIFPLIYQ